ncbi:hypothetical protein GH714_018717 [Hevea brasiliensis]|uniref:Solute carrier family 40 member n=1 Tax=Hevea brasiliensis TaxID=3981 RepID=A0A6A6M1V1_HEVBR|nr:hypothetical protein GH714_018717 [Hevea brasiliensis]
MEGEPPLNHHQQQEQEQQEPSPSQDSLLPLSIIRRLYIGQFLARWDARMWEFSVGLYMITLWPNSLILAAIYGAIESASVALFGPIVGQCAEKLTYVKSTNFTAFIFLVILTNISGAIGVLSTLAGTILIEREWVVVISEGHPPHVLTKMNSIIRRIDLTCKLLAPVVAGFIISFVSVKASAMTLVIWNTSAVLMEYWFFTSVYRGIPSLATLKWEGIPAFVIGIGRGVSAIIGIGATVVYPILQSRILTLRTGLWSIWSQWSCLLLLFASIWVQNNLFSAYMLMAGVATSRLGLWMLTYPSFNKCRIMFLNLIVALLGALRTLFSLLWTYWVCDGNNYLKPAGFLEIDFNVFFHCDIGGITL